MDKPIKPKRYKYLSNHNLIAQIVKSKNSYAEWVDPQYKVDPDAVINCVGKSVTEALEGQPQTVGRIVRVVTWDHIPLAPDRKRRGTEKNTTHERLNMLPFQVFTRDQEAWRCVAKSHWTGGIGNGHFEAIPRRARMTDELGKMMIKLADNISTKGNWSGYSYLDEMKALAVMTLIEHGLKFDVRSRFPIPSPTTQQPSQMPSSKY